MNNDTIINHLFEFMEHIGQHGKFLHSENGYKYTAPDSKSWPSKIFGIKKAALNFEKLHQEMTENKLPKSLAVAEDKAIEDLLLKHNFVETSVVKAMSLKLPKRQQPKSDFHTITQVNSDNKAAEFSRIASKAFDYEILLDTIIHLVNKSKDVRLYLGKHDGTFVSCGIIYSNRPDVSGIHMIGTLPEHRGIGLGKIMTNKLLMEANVNGSKDVVLVASETGERIYSKIGFVTHGALKSYTV